MTAHARDDLYKKMNSFVRDWDDGNVELKPRPDSQLELTFKDKFVLTLGLYKNITRLYRSQLEVARLKNKATVSWLTTDTDTDALDAKKLKELLEAFGNPELNKAALMRQNAAIDLEQNIDEARAYGMIHGTEGVLEKLRDCEQDNKVLRKENTILIARIAELEKFNKTVQPLDEDRKDKDDHGLSA